MMNDGIRFSGEGIGTNDFQQESKVRRHDDVRHRRAIRGEDMRQNVSEYKTFHG